MSDTKSCDMCTKTIWEPEPKPFDAGPDLPVVFYELHRRDTSGYGDTLDICSAECLAVAAVGDGHMRGIHEEHAATQRRDRHQPKRRWWQRRAA